MIEYISTILAVAGFATSVYFSNRSLRQNIKAQEDRRHTELLKRQDDAIKRAERDTQRHTEIIGQLNTLVTNTATNSREIACLRTELKTISERQIRDNQDLKSAFQRIEQVEERVEQLRLEHHL